MPNNEDHHCRVCGLYFDSEPWGEDGKTPLFDFCPCCGVEFGYEDCLMTGVKKYRSKWIEGGQKWFKEKYKPNNWSWDEQRKNIPKEFQ